MVSSEIGRKCRICNVILTTDNLLPSRLEKHDWICSNCASKKLKARYQTNKSEILERQHTIWELRKNEINARHRQRYAEDKEYRQRLSDYNKQKYATDKDFREKSKERARRRALDNPEEVKAGHKKYHENNGDIINAERRRLYKDDPEYNSKIKAEHKQYRESNPDKIRLKKHNDHRILKTKVINHYGGKCIYCGQNNLDFLTIGHKNNDGSKHRFELGGQHRQFVDIYVYLIRVNFVTSYELQVECWNHNEGRRRYWWDKPPNEQRSDQRYSKRVFLICFEHYGNKCSCCGDSNPIFLSLGHRNDDGAKHLGDDGRRLTGRKLAAWLIAHNFKCDFEIQLECFNCNMGKKANFGICPHNPQ